MSKVNLNLISVSQARDIHEKLKGVGIPTNGRVLILSPTGEVQTQSGLFVPSDRDKETVPRKGVVVQMSNLSKEQLDDYPGLQVGSVVTYGIYAGKEVDVVDVTGQVVTILSLNEILYIETNK